MEGGKQIRNHREKATLIYRRMTREEIFAKNRSTALPSYPSYMDFFNQEGRKLIINSLTGELPPDPLPTVNTKTISYYRRKGKAAFMTKDKYFGQNPHLLYESLWILATVDSNRFTNYLAAVMQFERDLPKYLESPYQEIREMAVIAAGNKFIGKEPDILKIAESGQLWVLVNHVCENKVHFRVIFPGIVNGNNSCFRCLYQLSNTNDEVIKDLMEERNQHSAVLQAILATLDDPSHPNFEYAQRIVGNICAQNENHVHSFIEKGLMPRLLKNVKHADIQVKCAALWTLSNCALSEGCDLSTKVLTEPGLVELLNTILGDDQIAAKVEAMQVYSNIFKSAEWTAVKKVIQITDLLSLLKNLFAHDDSSLSTLVVNAVLNLLELAPEDSDLEYLIAKLQAIDFESKVNRFTFMDDNKILCEISCKVMEYLDE